MAKNKQLSFPFDPKAYLSPFEAKYMTKLQTMHFGEHGQRPKETERALRAAGDAISNLFGWEDTVEGMNFWAHACDALVSMSDEMARRQEGDDLGEDCDLPLPPPFPFPFDRDGGCMADFDRPDDETIDDEYPI